MGYGNGLSFSNLREYNADRLEQAFDGHPDWSLGDWVCAVTGELGEAANVIKKVQRGDFTLDEARAEIAEEIADTITYLDLLAHKCGIENLGQVIVDKFNEVSKRPHVQYPGVMRAE